MDMQRSSLLLTPYLPMRVPYLMQGVFPLPAQVYPCLFRPTFEDGRMLECFAYQASTLDSKSDPTQLSMPHILHVSLTNLHLSANWMYTSCTHHGAYRVSSALAQAAYRHNSLTIFHLSGDWMRLDPNPWQPIPSAAWEKEGSLNG
eukprot:1158758-Pelagomonas_calceolata.AAC.2